MGEVLFEMDIFSYVSEVFEFWILGRIHENHDVWELCSITSPQSLFSNQKVKFPLLFLRARLMPAASHKNYGAITINSTTLFRSKLIIRMAQAHKATVHYFFRGSW